jgi:hypothetical protein
LPQKEASAIVENRTLNVRRKPQVKPETVVAPEILERAKDALNSGGREHPVKCSVCGDPAAVSAEEPLCWVCRRLKISAWHDIEQSMPMQD